MHPISPQGKPRLDWIDSVKGLGILLMFYGHVLQSRAGPEHASATDQLRFVYSFHMPLFFVLAGFFFRPIASDTAQRIWQLVVRRLVPVLFFGVLMLPAWFLFSMRHHQAWWSEAAPRAASYLHGAPTLDWVTWFLVCLFVCELMALVFLPRLKSMASQLLFGLACIWVGVLSCGHPGALHGWVGSVGGLWFICEAVVGLGFYAIGHALYPWADRLTERRGIAIAIAALATFAVLTTFQLNHPGNTGVVMMAAEQHGFVLDFAFTALAGSTAMVAWGILWPHTRWLPLLGRNTLALLGLNGLFFHFVNPKLAEVWPLADSPISVALYALVITAASLLACAPLVYALNRYVPQLVGKSRVAGPWLPALEATRMRPVQGQAGIRSG